MPARQEITPTAEKSSIESMLDTPAMEFSSAAVRERILEIQEGLMAVPEHHIECPLKHAFAPGVYAREILLPAGSFVIGKIHKHAHLNIVSKGRCSVMTEFGPQEIDATQEPQTFVSQPGTKRAVHALEDTVWTTIHLTNETDLAKIEDEIIAKSYEEFELLCAQEAQELLK